MNRKVSIAILFILGICIYSCTPYDSDRVNTGLIQGKWVLADAERTVMYDTVNVDYNKELTFLIFEGNKCSQHMSDIKDTIDFTFVIRNYELRLYKDDKPFRKLDIDLLSADSLILSVTDNIWIYKKAGQ
ncbi:hypothetical protein [Prevotella sp. 10(H)]|uniref:hypothetical protein n=1 Tax=Prevotella sp. 10(H) TaxID=1158294 RepID=UPI000689E795|nr:hypothetical protein [Prevotella sp. 10(H)]